MLSYIEKVDIYEIIVDPCHSVKWKGKFNFKPTTEDVAAAIREDISELDPDDDHEADIIRELRTTLELVTYRAPELLGNMSIAGTYIGEITIAIIKVFGREEPAMMPTVLTNPYGEMPALTDTSEVPV